MKPKTVKSSLEVGSYDLIDASTGEILIRSESFAVCDNVRDSIVYGCHMQDECGEVARNILSKNLG